MYATNSETFHLHRITFSNSPEFHACISYIEGGGVPVTIKDVTGVYAFFSARKNFGHFLLISEGVLTQVHRKLERKEQKSTGEKSKILWRQHPETDLCLVSWSNES